jgi:hypothetical protein
MYEVYIRMQFDEPCLGNERGADDEPTRMRRNSNGTVIFLQSWWCSMASRAVDGYNKHQKDVTKILWTPEIDGTTSHYKRYYIITEGDTRVRKYKLHEAFNRGDIIGVKALVPDGIPLDDLRDIMQLAGTYCGISPYGWRKGYGKFKVLEISKVYNRRKDAEGDSEDRDKGEPVMDHPSNE